MTILKKLAVSLAIAPLMLSIAFAAGGNDPIKGIDIIVRKPVERQAIVKQPATTKERRIIKQRDVKAIDSGINKHSRHNEVISQCYSRYGNPPTVTLNGKTMSVDCGNKTAKLNHDIIDFVLTPITTDITDNDYTRE